MVLEVAVAVLAAPELVLPITPPTAAPATSAAAAVMASPRL
jgi:hypothetical protein